MRRWTALGLAAMTLSGCAAETAEERDARPEPADPPPTTPAKVDVWGSALDYASSDPATAKVDGVEVCVTYGETQCTTTTHDGGYEVGGFQPDSHVTVRFTKEGYVPAFSESELSSAGGHADGAMLSVARVTELAEIAGVEAPGTTGGVVVTAFAPAYGVPELIPGISFAIVEPAPMKSVYVDDLGAPSADQPKTGKLGWGAALGLNPGRVVGTLTHEHSDYVCGIATYQGILATRGTFEVDVVAGMLTHIVVYCLPQAWL